MKTTATRRILYGAGLIGAIAVIVIVVSFVLWESWLATPITGKDGHSVAENLKWHGRLMVAAWAVLLPTAVVLARYFKITPRQKWPARLDNPFWFKTHRRLGNLLVGVATIALILALLGRGLSIFSSFHSILGWIVVLLMYAQLLGAYQRGTHGGPINPYTRESKPESEWPGDHFSLTKRRIFFEYSHKAIGYLLVITAAVAIVSGLWSADALRWMWIGLGLLLTVWVVAMVVLQRRVGAIDTYQAIWGLDETLPGYKRRPIGIGITRFTRENASDAPWQEQQQSIEAPPTTSTQASEQESND